MIKNTNNKYGLVSIILHWLMGILFIAEIVIVLYKKNATTYGTEINSFLMKSHFVIGIILLFLIVIRLIWTFINKKPKSLSSSRFINFLSRVVHYGLYIIMIVMPFSGYMGTGADINLGLFTVPRFYNTGIFDIFIVNMMGMSWESFEPIMDNIHKKYFPPIVMLLIILHVMGVVYHSVIKRDGTLKRMITYK